MPSIFKSFSIAYITLHLFLVIRNHGICVQMMNAQHKFQILPSLNPHTIL
ncbi:hypothetical protein Hanom_Chr11g01024831 [Helianthus anomalus]